MVEMEAYPAPSAAETGVAVLVAEVAEVQEVRLQMVPWVQTGLTQEHREAMVVPVAQGETQAEAAVVQQELQVVAPVVMVQTVPFGAHHPTTALEEVLERVQGEVTALTVAMRARAGSMAPVVLEAVVQAVTDRRPAPAAPAPVASSSFGMNHRTILMLRHQIRSTSPANRDQREPQVSP